MKQEYWYLFCILVVSLLIRIPSLDLPLFGDEIEFVVPAIEGTYSVLARVYHPPLGTLTYAGIAAVGATDIWLYRLLPLLANLLSIIILFFIGKELYGTKTGLFTAGLFGFAFHSVLASLQIDIDAFLMIFLLLSVLFFYKFQKEKRHLIPFGISLGLLALTKYTAVIAFVAFFVFVWIQRSFTASVRTLYKPYGIALLTFLPFPIMSLITAPEVFLNTISWGTVSVTGSSLPFFVPLFFLFLFVGPGLIFLSILQASRRQNKDILAVNFILIALAFHLFILKRGDFSRYFMLTLPFFCLLSAKFIRFLKKKEWIIITSLSILLFAIMFYINIQPILLLPHTIGAYSQALYAGTWQFIYPVAISTGSWFAVNFFLIMTIGVIFLLGLIFLFFEKREKPWRIGFCGIIAIFIAFNFLLISEYTFHSLINPASTVQDMIDYVDENDVPQPIFFTHKIFWYYITDDEITLSNFRAARMYRLDEADLEEQNELLKNGGTVLYLNFAKSFSKHDIPHLEECAILKDFSSGSIYSCTPVNE